MTTESIEKLERYIQKENVEATQLDDEWILLNKDHYTVTKINEVGGFCWSFLQEPRTIESLIRAVETEFGLDESYETVEMDIESFLAELIRCDLIEYAH